MFQLIMTASYATLLYSQGALAQYINKHVLCHISRVSVAHLFTEDFNSCIPNKLFCLDFMIPVMQRMDNYCILI